MIFKRLTRALGIGGPSVETELSDTLVTPGGYLVGEIRVCGGDHDVEIQGIHLSLVTRVEAEYEDAEGEEQEYLRNKEFHRFTVADPFSLASEEEYAFSFELQLPWELPISVVDGEQLAGMTVGLRTELAVEGALDKGDLDPLEVEPLPSQQSVLDALASLGFQLKGAEVDEGFVEGVDHELPFNQEIKLLPTGDYGGLGEIELSFFANEDDLVFLLKAEDESATFQIPHEDAVEHDWESELGEWFDSLA